MAAFAAAGDAGVIHHATREVGELAYRVAGLAGQGRGQVVAWFGYRCHSCKHLTVMASDTSTHDARVVHHATREVGELACRVAGLARQGRGQVVRRFRYRGHSQEHLSVMAGGASTGDTGMVHHARSRSCS